MQIIVKATFKYLTKSPTMVYLSEQLKNFCVSNKVTDTYFKIVKELLLLLKFNVLSENVLLN